MAKLIQGDLVPEFSSTTQDGTPFSNADLAGKRTVLYFYPKDNTSGCTLEAKSLRDGKAYYSTNPADCFSSDIMSDSSNLSWFSR